MKDTGDFALITMSGCICIVRRSIPLIYIVECIDSHECRLNSFFPIIDDNYIIKVDELL